MTRVPAALVLTLLAQEAVRTGDDRYRITAATLRSWVHRGHITRRGRGYDLGEIFDYLDRRSQPDTLSA